MVQIVKEKMNKRIQEFIGELKENIIQLIDNNASEKKINKIKKEKREKKVGWGKN